VVRPAWQAPSVVAVGNGDGKRAVGVAGSTVTVLETGTVGAGGWTEDGFVFLYRKKMLHVSLTGGSHG
jgi:hypothetical protein